MSLYDFFGKSSDTPSASASKNSRKHQRSSSDISKVSAKAKSGHKLTFQLPSESIVSNIDTSYIPTPLPKQRMKQKSTTQISTLSSNGSNNTKDVNKLSVEKTQDMKSPVSTGGNNSLISPIISESDNVTNNRTLSPIVSNTLQATIDQNRFPSNGSLSSSVYPNETSLSNSNNPSTSTLPDFTRQSSSIYPASTFGLDHRGVGKTLGVHKSGPLNSSSTIKRKDLLLKRKPPPPPLTIDTNTMNEDNDTFKSKNMVKSPSDTLRLSAATMSASTDGEFSPLNIIGHDTAGDVQSKITPLDDNRKLNPAKNVMFAQTGIEYEPPEDYDSTIIKYGSQDKNTHKHSRTLSSIEEITTALNKFQIEHEMSFNNTTLSNETELADETFSFISNPAEISNLNFSSNDEHHDSLENDCNKDTNADNFFVTKQNGSEILVKVKDLPELENGESLEHYIEKLKNTSTHAHPDLIKDQDRMEHLVQPPTLNTDSETSSASDVFFDVDESRNNIDCEKQNSVSQKNNVAELELHKNHDGAESGSVPSGSSYEDNRSERNVSVHYSGEKDLIGSLKDSFESLIKQVESYDNDYEGKVSSHSHTISTDISEDVAMEDGVWRRYSSGTNFFSDSHHLHDNDVRNQDIDEQFHNNSDKYPHSIDPVLVTPTDPTHFGGTNHHRDFDLDNEMDNNVTTDERNDFAASESLRDLYPIDSEYDLLAEDDSRQGSGFDSEFDCENESDSGNTGQNDENEIHKKNIAMLDSSEKYLTNSDYDRDGVNGDDDANDDGEGDYQRFLEFSPRSTMGFGSDNLISKTPDLYQQNSMCSGGALEKTLGLDRSAESSGSHINENERLVVMNTGKESTTNAGFSDHLGDEILTAPIPDIDLQNTLMVDEVLVDPKVYRMDIMQKTSNEKSHKLSTYDRREEPTVAPIQHSMVSTPAAPIEGTVHVTKNRRPPPNYPSTGRRSRGLSESTANPEMFIGGITQQANIENENENENRILLENEGKHIAQPDVISGSIMAGGTDGDLVTSMNKGESQIKCGGLDKAVMDSTEQTEPKGSKELSQTTDTPEEASVEEDNRKGEKCTYIENLRARGKKSMISTKPSAQVLPVSIRQNGTISHKKIPSHQLLLPFKVNKHFVAKSKTRMLASEIDNGELPDATMIHMSKKTKVPIHPDAAVIEASEQFNMLAKKRSNDLGRYNSVLSVRPHYGNGMRLFITNPDDVE